MLTPEIINKIESFVYQKPRSVDEIAKFLNKNWRTTDRYIADIEKEYGTIATRVFRKGSRGALKIVYWGSIEKIHKAAFQEVLEKKILESNSKEQFSTFDIFQYIEDKKEAYIQNLEGNKDLIELVDLIRSAKSQILIFSGNLSLINLRTKKIDLLSELESAAKRGCSIKVISKVDFISKQNLEKLNAINQKLGKECIEIRHREQPLRGFVFDNKTLRLKEVKEPTGKIHELDKKFFIFYNIQNKNWVEWISRIFWKMFSSSISAEKRLNELSLIK